MKRVWKVLLWTLGILILVLAVLAFVVSHWVNDLESEQVTEDLHVIYTNLGGNVAVLATGEGAVIVDTMTFVMQGREIRSLAEELTGEKVVMIINTHWHADHTHGNPAFDAGTRVISTARTKELLESIDAGYWEGDAASLLPNETFNEQAVIRLGEKTIELYGTGRGHTDGDLVAYFVEDATVHMGDLYFNRLYPFVDLAAGGSVQRWGDTVSPVLELGFEQVIPGHGPLSGRERLLEFQAFMEDLARAAREAANAGWTLEETLAKAELRREEGFQPLGFGPFEFGGREFVIQLAWEEATGEVERQ